MRHKKTKTHTKTLPLIRRVGAFQGERSAQIPPRVCLGAGAPILLGLLQPLPLTPSPNSPQALSFPAQGVPWPHSCHQIASSAWPLVSSLRATVPVPFLFSEMIDTHFFPPVRNGACCSVFTQFINSVNFGMFL